MPKILHLALSDSGGAGNAAYLLHRALRNEGLDSRLLVQNRRHSEADHVYVIPMANRWCYALFSRIGDRFVKGASRGSERARYFYPDFNYPMLSPHKIEKMGLRSDAIIAHSVSGYASSSLLAELSRAWGAPVFWYLMDMGLLTGGCHFSFGCEEYARQCGCCPALQSNQANDWSHYFWQRRRAAALATKGVVVAPNQWLASQAKMSGIFFDRPQTCIELSIGLDSCRPIGRKAARKALELQEDGKYIFFGAYYADERRKGVSYLIEALKRLAQSYESNGATPPTVITAGATLAATSLNIPLPHYHLGYLDVETRLPLAYQAADVFVSPAIEDSGPMMILESLGCGTPVVAFDIGVARDVLVENQTGYIADLLDDEDLANGIESILLSDVQRANSMSAACRKLAQSRFSSSRQAIAFRDLILSSLKCIERTEAG